jgi:hypothetical protein
VIIAQTILTVYAGDQIFKLVAPGLCVPRPGLHWHSFMIRIGGTLLGLIAAILIWYIGRHSALIRRVLCHSPSGAGNGGGNGNPYGLAASYAVLIVPVMFVRLFAPPQFLPGAILGTVRS